MPTEELDRVRALRPRSPRPPLTRWGAVAGGVAGAVVRRFPTIALAATLVGCDSSARPAAESTAPSSVAGFVGSARCGACHAQEFAAWRGSQHSAAMQPARDGTVLGDFADATFTEDGLTSRFFRRDGRFVVTTIGGDSAAHDYEVRYTFGVAPLQQYLVAFPGGRLQPLPLAWDTRPSADGGRRWFTLDHVAPLGAHDDGHWTGRGLNWNYMCADCHATAVRKRYVAAADSFDTRFSEAGVGCEGCHGPGEAHSAWGRWPAWMRTTFLRDPRLSNRLDERRTVQWRVNAATAIPARSRPRTTSRETETCAPCHARRVHLADGWTAGEPLLDYYDPAVLVPGLYHPDGQQADEVYDHASFLQSRMHAAGVTCADCHEPHTQKLRLPGRGVCLQCHLAARYDTTSHHGHQRGGAGSECAACHMPTATYLEIDPRHDHSIRIPRPDRTQLLGVPNACATCHADRSPSWAVAAIASWKGRGAPGAQTFAEAFAADERAGVGTKGAVTSLAGLVAVARDTTQSPVARASAFARMAVYDDSSVWRVARLGVRDSVDLVRRWAVEAMGGAPPAERIAVLGPRLGDARRAIRLRAAWFLAPLARTLPTPEFRSAFARTRDEFVASQRYNADRADHRVALGIFFLQLADTAAALEEFRVAAAQWPRQPDAIINVSSVLAQQGKEGEGEQALRAAIAQVPDVAPLWLALAQSLTRQGRTGEAMAALDRAASLPDGDREATRRLRERLTKR